MFFLPPNRVYFTKRANDISVKIVTCHSKKDTILKWLETASSYSILVGQPKNIWYIYHIYIYQIKYAHNWTQSTHIQQTNIYIDNKTLNPDSSFRISEVKWVKWPSATHLASLEITFPSFPALKLPHPKICPSSKLFRSKTRTIGDWELGSVCHVDGHGSGSQIRVETFQKKLPTDVLHCDVQLWLSMSSRISQLSLVSI